jgi:hypothetical protein
LVVGDRPKGGGVGEKGAGGRASRFPPPRLAPR